MEFEASSDCIDLSNIDPHEILEAFETVSNVEQLSNENRSYRKSCR